MNTFTNPLSEQQLELLQMFARPVESNDWQNIKVIITKYFANKSIEEANKVWDNNNWDNIKIQELLNSHLRTPYIKQ
jgi:hypothetical protein